MSWTDEDLKKLYVEGGLGACRAAFPDADPDQMSRRARYLGFASRRIDSQWTKAEDALMLQHYEELGAKGVKPKLPARSILAITRRAGILRLKNHAAPATVPTFAPWTAEETQIIEAAVEEPLATLMGMLPGRSAKSVAARRDEIRKGVKPTRPARTPWSAADDQVIRECYPESGPAVLAERLGRSVLSIRKRASDLKVHFTVVLRGRAKRVRTKRT